MTVKTGLDMLVAERFQRLAGARVGLFTNPSAVDTSLRSAFSLFKAAADQGVIKLVALFAPEHGLDAATQDGVRIGSSTEGDLPVYSLYGETQRPTAQILDGLDMIVCDIQDIGVRYYTFLWTITYILEAAGERSVRVLILDRPNPLGGIVIEGAPLGAALASLVGRFSVPTRHGMTLGEVATLFNARWNPRPATLDVIPCAGWRRSMLWEATGLTFVPPSPNMPHLETVRQYPGACLIEGTTLSEGRGTTLPFEIVGAPFIDGLALADHLNAQNLPGARFRPHNFQPSSSKWAGERCGGVQVHVVDPAAWRAIRVWLAVIGTIRALYPDQFGWWLPGKPGVEAGKVYHFDRLIGSSEARLRIDAGQPLDDLLASWEAFSRDYEVKRRSYLLYT